MVFCFLAVKHIGSVNTVLFAKSNNSRHRQRNTLVSRSEESFKLDLVLGYAVSVELSKLTQLSTCLIVTAVNEIGSFSSAFEGELSEGEDTAVHHKLNKFFFVGHNDRPFIDTYTIISHSEYICKCR